MNTKNLLVELFVEELPPKALKELGESFAREVYKSLQRQEFIVAGGAVASGVFAANDTPFIAFASPRRLGVLVRAVLVSGRARYERRKLMPVSVALSADGQATPALLKKLASMGADACVVPSLQRAQDGKTETLFWEATVPGASLADGLQKALDEALAKLPIPKVMTYQLADGWTDVKFVRPAHRLIALHGADVVPVKALGLEAGRSTLGHRFEAAQAVVEVESADSYATQLREQGAVIASFAERRAVIANQLEAAATVVGNGVRAIADEALLDEVTALVERPNVLVCRFEKEFLDVPQECLILTMKANQKYFPLLDAAGKLTNQFLVVSNIAPADASFVIGGNERVVRPRLADAKFFFDQDRKKSLASRVAGLDKVVYHNKLGTQGERMCRVCGIAGAVAQLLERAGVAGADLASHAEAAARLAKTDLLTDMVGEFPELQGIMGGYYALNDGLSLEVAQAIEDHYKPRFAGDALPRNAAGVVVALADKLETLVGMFGIGNLPSGDKDPFALRRHALGVIRILIEKNLPLQLDALLACSVAPFGDKITDATAAVADFIYERLKFYLSNSSLEEEALVGGQRVFQADASIRVGFTSLQIDAVLALRPQRLGDVPKRLVAVRAFAALPVAAALAAANKRISNILKKVDQSEVAAVHVSALLLKEPAEQALYAAMQDVAPRALVQFEALDYSASLQTLAALRVPVDAFFEGVMVNVQETDLRQNRLGLLKTLHIAMNRVADLSRLAA